MRHVNYMPLALLTAVVCSCADIDVEQVKAASSHDYEGYRYYMPRPYFLVTETNQAVRVDLAGKAELKKGDPEKLVAVGTLVGLDRSSPIQVKLVGNADYLTIGKNSTATVDKKTGAVSLSLGLTNRATKSNYTVALQLYFGSTLLAKGKLIFVAETAAGRTEYYKLAVASVKPPDRKFSVSVMYLPDPSREFAIDIQSGIGGTAELNLKLTNGWMLTEVGAKTDAQADETVAAVAEVIGSLAELTTVFTPAGGNAGVSSSAPTPTQWVEGVTPGLYGVEFDKTTGSLVRIYRVQMGWWKP